MADRYPKSMEELTAENERLRATVAHLQRSVGTLQSTLVAREAELARALRPKREPRVLDKNSLDSFQRPYR